MFMVIENNARRYHVVNRMTGQKLRFSFGKPLYEAPGRPAAEWGNYYAARGFAQRMSFANA